MWKDLNIREKYRCCVLKTWNSPFNTDNHKGFLQLVKWVFFFFKLGAGYVATQKANDVTVARVVQCHVPVTEQTNRTNPHKLVVLLLECIDRLLIGLLFFFSILCFLIPLCLCIWHLEFRSAIRKLVSQSSLWFCCLLLGPSVKNHEDRIREEAEHFQKPCSEPGGQAVNTAS